MALNRPKYSLNGAKYGLNGAKYGLIELSGPIYGSRVHILASRVHILASRVRTAGVVLGYGSSGPGSGSYYTNVIKDPVGRRPPGGHIWP